MLTRSRIILKHSGIFYNDIKLFPERNSQTSLSLVHFKQQDASKEPGDLRTRESEILKTRTSEGMERSLNT